MKTSSSVPWWLTTFGWPSARNQRLRLVERDDAAVIDNRDAVAQVFRLFHVMGGHQNRAAARPERFQQRPELPPRLRVKSGRGFIQEQQVRIAGQRTGERQALFLSARQLADAAAALALELDDGEQFLDVRPRA